MYIQVIVLCALRSTLYMKSLISAAIKRCPNRAKTTKVSRSGDHMFLSPSAIHSAPTSHAQSRMQCVQMTVNHRLAIITIHCFP